MRLTPNNPALTLATTIHPKTIRSPSDTNLLKPASQNSKLGKGSNVVSKGRLAGMPMYQLSLTERATCPSSCTQWDNCYGNNMAFAHRIDHTHPDFLPTLDAEINLLTRKYKHGVLIRPHVIGDYYGESYVAFWRQQTEKHPNLHIFGFTAHLRDSTIGQMIAKWNESPRVWVRFSNQGGDMSANVGGEGIPCPQQTGKTESCLTCGICWSTEKPVMFLEH